MIIHITPDEFEPEFQTPWKQELIKSPNIDYATNAIHGWIEGKDVIIFRFKDYGFINDNMKIAINCIYDDAKSFINGLCIVKVNNRWGIIDTAGKEIIPLQYESIKNTINYEFIKKRL